MLGVIFNSYADDSDRIDRLEKKVQELNLRISKLESLLRESSENKVLVPSHEGWKSVHNWRKLATDMSASDVQKILGEPQRVDGGNLATWYYGNGGTVMFFNGRVNRWMEPRE
ncbi:MAG: hypothetical protein GC149_09925 [Gammaproteobacteria bacterium]|nr:hypothetical protein [Gammaproteobacteria bacterium]